MSPLAALVLLSTSILSYIYRFLCRFLRYTTVMGRKKIIGDELSVRTKGNGYQQGAHRDKDGLQDQDKRVDRAKRNQNAVLDRYVL